MTDKLEGIKVEGNTNGKIQTREFQAVRLADQTKMILSIANTDWYCLGEMCKFNYIDMRMEDLLREVHKGPGGQIYGRRRKGRKTDGKHKEAGIG